MKLNRSSGQTLLELVIAVAVVAIVMTALISAVTASLRFGQASRSRSTGIKMAQEGLEMTRKLRDGGGWASFLTYADGTGRWCLDAAGVYTTDSAGGTCPVSAGSTFWRVVTFVWTGEIMEVTVTVSWGERNSPSTASLKTYFTEWR